MAAVPGPEEEADMEHLPISAEELPSVGSIVMLRGRLAIVRFVGEVEFADRPLIGVELKGAPIPQGNDGTGEDGKRYFNAEEGCGIFLTGREIVREISPEEILDKLAGLHDHVQGKEEANALVEYEAFEEVARENRRLNAQLTELELIVYNLMIQNEMLQEQSMAQMMHEAELHDKVFQFAKKIGMRRPTLSIFDDQTLGQIGEIVRKNQANADREAADDEKAGGYEPPTVDGQAEDVRERKKRQAKQSIEIAREYVEKHITGPMKARARESVDISAQAKKGGHAKKSSIDFLTEWNPDGDGMSRPAP